MTSADTNAQAALERRRAKNRVAQRRFRQKKAQPEPELALWPEMQAGSAHDTPSPHSAPPRSAILPSADNATRFFGGLISAFDSSSQPMGSCDTEKRRSSRLKQDSDRGHFSMPSAATLVVATNSYSPTTSASSLLSTHSPENAANTSSVPKEQNTNTSLHGPINSVNPKSNNGWNSLHIAARSGHDQVVQILLRSGKVSCDEGDSDGLTALMHAVISGHAEIVRSLLLHGASVTGKCTSDKRPSALHWAVRYRREDTLRLLLTHCSGNKALVDCFDDVGRTSLHLASELDFVAGVVVLLEFGADPCLNTRVSQG